MPRHCGLRPVFLCIILSCILCILFFCYVSHETLLNNYVNRKGHSLHIKETDQVFNQSGRSVFVKDYSNKNGWKYQQMSQDAERIERFLRYASDDILHMDPPKFLPQYKNPCFYETLSSDDRRKRLRCLPYFMLIGVTKSATSELFKSIIRHPDIIKPAGKEPQYWPRARHCSDERLKVLYEPGYRHPEFGQNHLCACISKYKKSFYWEGNDTNCSDRPRSWSKYMDFFDKTASTIAALSSSHEKEERLKARKLITGEGSPSTIWDNKWWWDYSVNENDIQGPPILNAHYIKKMLPQVKIIVILRNPADRLLSDYAMVSRRTHIPQSSDQFHLEVVREINFFEGCLKKYDPRYCIYHTSTDKVNYTSTIRFHVGFYAIFIRDWFKLFPRDQFHFLRLEEFSKYPKESVEAIFKFLGLREANLDYEKTLRHKISPSKRYDSTLNKTRTLLLKFYEPYTKQLAELLNDDKYFWHD